MCALRQRFLCIISAHLTNVKLKGEYKRVDTQNGYAGNFVEEGFDIIVPNTYDGNIVSFAVDFVY